MARSRDQTWGLDVAPMDMYPALEEFRSESHRTQRVRSDFCRSWRGIATWHLFLPRQRTAKTLAGTCQLEELLMRDRQQIAPADPTSLQLLIEPVVDVEPAVVENCWGKLLSLGMIICITTFLGDMLQPTTIYVHNDTTKNTKRH